MNKILYIVATPIGNLGDLSQRALDTLKNVDLILAEDTRHSQVLLNNFGIKTPCMSLHKFNEKDRLDKIQELFDKGQKLAIISDAGTPAISDPGAVVVEYSLNNHIKVVPIPGPSALTTLLSASGIQGDRVTFIGFLPHKKTEKRKTLLSISGSIEPPHTVAFFESPQRIVDTLRILSELMPEETVTIGRELTKIHEEILQFKAKDYPGDLKEKGEFTVLIRLNKKYNDNDKVTDFDHETGEPRKVASMLANYLKIKPKDAYNLLIKLKEEYIKE
jgi:16S rRNA (cytidine1402-2'-O)-methyltransferase